MWICRLNWTKKISHRLILTVPYTREPSPRLKVHRNLQARKFYVYSMVLVNLFSLHSCTGRTREKQFELHRWITYTFVDVVHRLSYRWDILNGSSDHFYCKSIESNFAKWKPHKMAYPIKHLPFNFPKLMRCQSKILNCQEEKLSKLEWAVELTVCSQFSYMIAIHCLTTPNLLRLIKKSIIIQFNHFLQSVFSGRLLSQQSYQKDI